jgi:hypothetical protein
MECVSRSLPPRLRPSPLEWRVGSHNDISRPAQCSLTLRPARTVDPHKGHIFGVLQVIRCLLTRPEYFRLERELAGLRFHQGEQCALQGTHTNAVERAMRPIKLNAKNSLFAGCDVGASYCSSGDALIKQRDFAADLEISGDVIVWHRLRGTRRLAAGRQAG